MTYATYEDTFEYTDYTDGTGSSAVDDIYYNTITRELLVILTSGYGYVYHGVPVEVFNRFNAAGSLGRFYNEYVKGKFTSQDAGYDPDVEVAVVNHRTVGTPKDLKVTDSTVVSGPTFNLSGDTLSVYPADRVTYNHVVHFTTEGGNEVKTYSVEAGSNVHEAVEALGEISKILGVDINVKGVFVSFE